MQMLWVTVQQHKAGDKLMHGPTTHEFISPTKQDYTHSVTE